MNLSLSQILIDGLLLSVSVSVVILASLYFNARLWLHDYPPEIRARVEPMTALEKRQRMVVVVAFVAIGFVVCFNSINRLHAENNGTPSLLAVFLHVYGLFFIFNLFDAVILDFVLLTLMKPKFVIIPGTEDVHEQFLHSYRFQIINFIKGVFICAVVSGIIALLIFVL